MKLTKTQKRIATGIVAATVVGGVAYANWMSSQKGEVRINTGRLELSATSLPTQILVDHDTSIPSQVEIANMLKGYVSVDSNLTSEGVSTTIDGIAPNIDIISSTQYVFNNKMPAKVSIEILDNQGNLVPTDTVFIEKFGHGFDVWVGATLGQNTDSYPIIDVDTATQRLYDNYDEISNEQWYLDMVSLPMEQWDFNQSNFEQITTQYNTLAQIEGTIYRALEKAGVMVDMEQGIISPVTEPVYINSYFGYTINEKDVATNGGQDVGDYGFTVKINLIQLSATDVK